MEKHNFVTIADLTKEKILYMIEMAEEFEKHPNRELLKGKVVATLFFEPSTRTRLSFETAANRLGARVIGFADPKITSGTKGHPPLHFVAGCRTSMSAENGNTLSVLYSYKTILIIYLV